MSGGDERGPADATQTRPIAAPRPQPPFGPDAPGYDGRDGGPAADWSDGPAVTGVLDRPVDDVDLRTRLARPGLARSTAALLLLLGAVVFFGLGSLVGRATAPDTGPGSVADTLGVVEAVDVVPGGFPVVTLRSADGTLTSLQTSAGTVVAVPTGRGTEGVTVGTTVSVSGERDGRGLLVATRVDLAR